MLQIPQSDKGVKGKPVDQPEGLMIGDLKCLGVRVKITKQNMMAAAPCGQGGKTKEYPDISSFLNTVMHTRKYVDLRRTGSCKW